MRYIQALPLAAMMLAPPLPAQSGAELVQRGISAYRALEYDEATRHLQRAVSLPASRALSDSTRAEAFAYLGAAALFQGQAESAGVAFNRALEADPRFRADELVFPPEVTEVFEAVRRRTAFVTVRAPRDTTIRPGQDRFTIRLHSSAPHAVFVELALPDGRISRQLYAGGIQDSLDVVWDGLGPDERTVLEGPLSLRVISQGDLLRRTVHVALETEVQRADTLDFPPPPEQGSLLPERERNSERLGALVKGVMTGIAAAALPSLVGSSEASRTRYLVGAAIGVAGFVGFATQSEQRSIPANVEANATRRRAWMREVDRIRAENERRRRSARMQITTQRPLAGDPEVR
jgi:hypothetical protein